MKTILLKLAGSISLIFGLMASQTLAAIQTNYSQFCGGVTYKGANGWDSDEAVFKLYYDGFMGFRIERAITEFSLSSFSPSVQTAQLVVTIYSANSGVTNYGFDLYAYTNGAGGTVNTGDYGAAGTLVGTVCSNLLPVTDQQFTNDITAVLNNAVTSGVAYIGFRIQTNPDSTSAFELRFVSAQSGTGPRIAWLSTAPIINNNGGASGISTNAAILNGMLSSTGAAPAYVNIYWGTNDGGTNVAGWSTNVVMGQTAEGSFSNNITGLTTNTLYYYRCFASNSFGFAWAPGSTNFTTLPGPVPGTLRFAASTAAVSENAGMVALAVMRVGGSNGAASVNYVTSNGTARAGTEYTAAGGTLSWSDNDSSSKTVSVAIIDNSEYGTSKTFSVILTNATTSVLSVPATAVVTIVENDPPPSPGVLQFSASSWSVAEDGGSVALIVQRAEGSNGAASVEYTTADGTAAAGTDYTAKSGTLSWTDGDSASKSISVTILDNSAYSGSRAFQVRLGQPSGAALGTPGTATVTIVDNEPQPIPPAPPGNVSASDGAYWDKIRITWGMVTNATYYQIWRGTNLSEMAMLKQQFVLAGASYNDTNAEALVTYYYQLKSVNSDGAGDFSAADTGWRRVLPAYAAADFDGDGLADPAAFVSGSWYVWLSGAGYARVGPYSFGAAGNAPMAGDFDGDAKADPAVYDGAQWTQWLSGSGYALSGPYAYSVEGMSPTVADFDGDRKADPAGVVLGNPSTGSTGSRQAGSGQGWYVWLSSADNAKLGPFPFGDAMSAPVAGDYDGDGVGDPATSAALNWTEWRSGSGYVESGPYQYGLDNAQPVAGDFDGDGLSDPACVLDNSWYVWLSAADYLRLGPFEFPAP